jgi:hypothetical protein
VTTGNAVIVNGEPVFVGRPVRVWTETGLHFPGRPKRTETRAVWLHHTGGENSADGVYRTLRAAGTSVNFFIDQEGVIWQFADAMLATAHAGGDKVVLSANPWAIGVEIANRANNEATHRPNGKAHQWPRELCDDVIRGKHLRVTRFYPEQIASAVALCEALCKAFGLPLAAPVEEDGKVVARTMTIDELRELRGVGAHYLNHFTKNDPGTEVLLAVNERGKLVV